MQCARHGNAVAEGPVSDELPIVVLYERDAWLSGFDVPTLVAWADGTVVFRRDMTAKTALLQAHIEDATDLSTRTVASLRDVPSTVELTSMTDMPTVEIVFRDGPTWRIADAYGLERKTDVATVPESARPIFRTYHALLDATPATGEPAPIAPRPAGWPRELATYHGQATIDQLVFCRYRR